MLGAGQIYCWYFIKNIAFQTLNKSSSHTYRYSNNKVEEDEDMVVRGEQGE